MTLARPAAKTAHTRARVTMIHLYYVNNEELLSKSIKQPMFFGAHPRGACTMYARYFRMRQEATVVFTFNRGLSSAKTK